MWIYQNLPRNRRCLLQQVLEARTNVLLIQNGRQLAGAEPVKPVQRACNLVRHCPEGVPDLRKVASLARGGNVEDVPRH